jgi:hypothetical protein
MKFGDLNFLEPCDPLQACNGTALPYIHVGCVKENVYQSGDNTTVLQDATKKA